MFLRPDVVSSLAYKLKNILGNRSQTVSIKHSTIFILICNKIFQVLKVPAD